MNAEIYQRLLDKWQKEGVVRKGHVEALITLLWLTHSLGDFEKDIKNFKRKVSELCGMPATVSDPGIYFLKLTQYIENGLEEYRYVDMTFLTEFGRGAVEIKLVNGYDYSQAINETLLIMERESN